MVVQLRIAREKGRQDALDAEGAAHGGDVVITGTERVDEVLDVVGDVSQVVRQVREGIGQFAKTSTLEGFVVGQRADIFRDIPAEGLGDVPARVLAADAQELLVQQGTTLILNDMQRILEWNLLIGRRPRVRWNGILLRLEIKEVQRIGQFVQESLDSLRIDVVAVLQRALDLHVLDGADIFVPQVSECDDSFLVVIQLLAESEPSAAFPAIDIEHRRLRQMPSAVIPEGAIIRIVAVEAQVDDRFRSGERALRGSDHLRNDLVLLLYKLGKVCRIKQAFDIQLVAISARHLDSALLKDILLIGDIPGVLDIFRVILGLDDRAGRTLHFVDGPAARSFMEDIDGAVVPIPGKGCLGNILNASVHTVPGTAAHLGKVQAAVRILGGHFLEWAEVAHRKVPDDVAFFKARFERLVLRSSIRIVNPQPECLGTLPEEGVTGFGQRFHSSRF